MSLWAHLGLPSLFADLPDSTWVSWNLLSQLSVCGNSWGVEFGNFHVCFTMFFNEHGVHDRPAFPGKVSQDDMKNV